MCHLHHLLSSLSWSSERGRDCGRGRDCDFGKGAAHLEEVVISMVLDRMLLIRNPDSVSIARGIITSLRSAGRNLDVLNRHSWLMLTLLVRIMTGIDHEGRRNFLRV